MDSQTVREQFVIDTYRRLMPSCDAHIEAIGAVPLICLVTTQAGVGRYEVAAICDRYALNPQADADNLTHTELKDDNVWYNAMSKSESKSESKSK